MNKSDFDDEATRIMGEAFDTACEGLQDTGQPALVREIIAKRIIEERHSAAFRRALIVKLPENAFEVSFLVGEAKSGHPSDKHPRVMFNAAARRRVECTASSIIDWYSSG